MMFCYLRLSDNYQSSLNLIFITIVFGFIHGLGFAGAINEIFLPKEDIVKNPICFQLRNRNRSDPILEYRLLFTFGVYKLD